MNHENARRSSDRSTLSSSQVSRSAESDRSTLVGGQVAVVGEKRMESVYDLKAGTGKEFFTQDPGMQLHVGQPGMEAIPRDAEGLRVYYNKPLPAQPGLMVTEKEIGLSPASLTPIEAKRDNWWKQLSLKRRAVIIGSVSSLLLLIIVLAAVFGSRAAQQKDSKDSSQTTLFAGNGSTTKPADARTTRGAYKGSSIVTLHSREDNTGNSETELLVYQSYTGQLMMQSINASVAISDFVDGNFTATDAKVDLLGAPRPFNVSAANGTALAGTVVIGPLVNSSANGIYLIVYVAPNGTLCDLWSTNDALNQPWKPGSLGARNFQAPVGNGQRSALTLETGNCFSSKNPGWGVGLWAGGNDGQLHHYIYEWTTGTWAAGDVALHGTSGYSGAVTAASPATDYCGPKSVTLMTDPAGKLMYVPVNSTNATASNGANAVPAAFGSGFSADRNSTLVVAQTIEGLSDSFWLFYTGGTTSLPGAAAAAPSSLQMMRVSFADLVAGKPQFPPQSVDGIAAVPNSDLSLLGMTMNNPMGIVWNKSWLFYQANDSSIDWVLFGGDYPRGNILW